MRRLWGFFFENWAEIFSTAEKLCVTEYWSELEEN